MNALVRWFRFNLVGCLGMAVQLAALALLNRWRQGHYLIAAAVALELTLVHNFTWHVHYTWRDRQSCNSAGIIRRFIRFHLANGAASMLGNLGLMRVLVQYGRVPLLLANLIAILCCSGVNFCLSNRWEFQG